MSPSFSASPKIFYATAARGIFLREIFANDIRQTLNDADSLP